MEVRSWTVEDSDLSVLGQLQKQRERKGFWLSALKVKDHEPTQVIISVYANGTKRDEVH